MTEHGMRCLLLLSLVAPACSLILPLDESPDSGLLDISPLDHPKGEHRRDGGNLDLDGLDLDGTDLDGTDLDGPDLDGADLDGPDLNGPDAGPWVPPPGTICSADSWCWDNPRPQGHTLNGVWVGSATNIFAVGEHGTILYYDGQHWTREASGTTYVLNGVWGAGNMVWAVGQGGTILSRAASGSWSKVSSSTTVVLRAVWGSSPTNIWAVGNNGTVVYYNGTSWSPSSGTIPAAPLWAVWGNATSVYVAGQGGVWDASGVQQISPPPPSNLIFRGLWVDTAGSIATVAGNTLYVRPSTSTSWITQALTGTLTGVWGDTTGTLWVTDTDSKVWSAIGGTAKVDATLAQPPYSVHGTPSASGPVVVTVGVFGTTYVKDATNAWTALSSGVTGADLNAVWGVGDTLYAAGGSGVVIQRSASSTTPWVKPWISTSKALRGIWGDSTTNLWFVGDDGTILDHAGKASGPPGMFNTTLYGVWGNSSTDIVAVGTTGVVYDTTGWQKQMLPGTLRGIWGAGGQMFTVGDSGVVLHRGSVGSSWSSTNPAAADLTDVWGSSTTDVHAVGGWSPGAGFAMRYTGSSWTPHLFLNGNPPKLHGVHGRSASDIFAAGNSGTILHFDGSSWTSQVSGVNRDLYGVFTAPGASAWAVGQHGAVLRHP